MARSFFGPELMTRRVTPCVLSIFQCGRNSTIFRQAPGAKIVKPALASLFVGLAGLPIDLTTTMRILVIVTYLIVQATAADDRPNLVRVVR